MVSKFFDKLFSTEDEFSKKWMEKISRVLLGMVIFTIPFFIFLLWLYIRQSISLKGYEITLSYYTGIMQPIIVSYFVCFIGYLGKAYLSKRNEEANKLSGLSEENDDPTEGIDDMLTELWNDTDSEESSDNED